MSAAPTTAASSRPAATSLRGQRYSGAPMASDAVGRGRSETVFVGRQHELTGLLTEANHARAGRPRVVLLTGEPGIGKTALAHRFVKQTHGFQLCEASGEEAEQLLAFGVIEQL